MGNRKFSTEELNTVAMFNCTYGGMNIVEPNDDLTELVDTWGNAVVVDTEDNYWIIEEDGVLVAKESLDVAMMELLDKDPL